MPKRRLRPQQRLCTTCGWQRAEGPRTSECGTCAGYRRRTGIQRPPDVIARHARMLLGAGQPQPAAQPQLPLSA